MLNVNFVGVQLRHKTNIFSTYYLGIILDRTLTFMSHLDKATGKVKSGVNLVFNYVFLILFFIFQITNTQLSHHAKPAHKICVHLFSPWFILQQSIVLPFG